MAEAAEAGGTDSGGGRQSDRNTRFYCHKCSLQILPVLPDLVCPVCRGGFIEELSDVVAERREEFADVWANVVDRSNSRYSPQYLFNQIVAGFLDGVQTSGLGNLHGGGFIMPLHGNPGDYAWGHAGLDAVITHLLNQLDGAGPAPLTQQQIDAIPEAKISAEQVKANLQCSVCMEDFILEEVARRLECGHHFHAGCITPWLQIHATCPICRLQLTTAAENRSGDNPTTTENSAQAGVPPASYVLDGSGAASSSSAGAPTARTGSLGGRATPGTPSSSGAVQRRPATYQEDDCD
ncbi:E3 ubiquitin-protein ligase RNF115-like [Tropilaelaps mercedesae]|uniref:RING-type E3 ubiquitin transferase n=1 Tax=Tropilaelaps mercedesae TaxID=418985 RepID=A0A1V9XIK1_9ACAR|nr:E3 ubiquitin-protein ligase RNF115-like [Tropilaelaps mercedesae]